MLEELCDVPGLTIDGALRVAGRLKATPHGPMGLAYFIEHLRTTKASSCLTPAVLVGQTLFRPMAVCAGKKSGGCSMPTSRGIVPIAALKRSTAACDSNTSTT